jgi:hypothetical protein
MLFFRLIFLFLACAATASGEEIVLHPKSSANPLAPIAALILIEGSGISNDAYVPLGQAIQEVSNLQLWIGIPSFKNNTPNPLTMDLNIDATLAAMKRQGMRAKYYFYGGHSLGGAVLQNWVNKTYTNRTIDGQILMGSFLTRVFKTDYKFSYAVPTLTIGGELDGLSRVSRIAEAYYTQLLDPQLQGNTAFNKANFPVTVCEGSNFDFFPYIPMLRVKVYLPLK